MVSRSNQSLEAILNDFANKLIYESFNCARIGIIDSVDANNKTVTIELVDKMVIIPSEGESPNIKEFQPLINVPLHLGYGKAGGVSFPVVKGDIVLVLFNDRDIDNWFESGVVKAPNSGRAHDLSDAIAIPFLYSPLSGFTYNNTATSLFFAANNQKQGEINVDSLVEIKNTITDLKTVLTQLVGIFDGLVGATLTTSVGPASINAIPGVQPLQLAVKELINKLLK